MNDGYILEVLQYTSFEEARDSRTQPGLHHIGYMDAKFKTKADAAAYYDRHNAHMRPLNAHKTFSSDWDPVTKLAYIVRKAYVQIYLSVPPFNSSDASVCKYDDRGVCTEQSSRWLK